MKKGRWTTDELATLRARYPTEPTSAIAADLGRPRAGTASKAGELGLRKANKRPWTELEFDVIRARFPNEPAHAIAGDLDRHTSTIYYQAERLGVEKAPDFLVRMAKRPRRPRRDSWTEENLDELRRRYPHERTIDIAADLGRTYNATNTQAHKLGLVKTDEYMVEQNRRLEEGGRKHRIRPGTPPPNKGLRRPGWARGRMRETQFKPGHKTNNEMQVGECSLETKQKMWKRKMCMECRGGHQWMSLPRYVWMMANGPIPPGHVIRVDRWDKDNPEPPAAVTIDRLECLTKRENMKRNTIHNYPKPIVDAIQQAGRLQREINKQRGRHGKARRPAGKRADDSGSPEAPVRDP